MAMALLTRPNAAALWVGRCRLFCCRTLVSLPARREGHHFSALIFSNVKLSSRIGLTAVPAVSRREFCVRAATGVNDSGSVDSTLIQSMGRKIKEQLNAESVIVKDSYGDGRHVSIDVISTAFEGQSAVGRQRMVYKAIWEELQNTVHAVDQMTTRTPAEAAAEG
ncbi:protein BOLA4, chloroplastic/mitochondrial [Coffea eugenioides]|uniref:Protein BOLA4, chloroplastic/mitochondrial n=1 Tax=Coffea arabica TaxID=13443 RepID=A0A6P6W2Z1_COFAR|nr:protein BOLA4, chloroplastic/mitochondrial-like [Coffea arabica]XP_027161033.1 protein BOLA4, chloroplastic/mitochondrial [Coffea eugenioides]